MGVIVAVPGQRIGKAAGTAAVAVALIVTLGLGYAFDASPRSVDLYGHSRETAAAGLVLGFFAVAVPEVGMPAACAIPACNPSTALGSAHPGPEHVVVPRSGETPLPGETVPTRH